MAVFSNQPLKLNVPEDMCLRPQSIFGVTKVYNEELGSYYHTKYGLDFRSIRYPGLIYSNESSCHNITDYATQVFANARRGTWPTCYLKANTALPMIHVSEAVQATVQLLEADSSVLSRRVYNLAGLSISPRDLAAEIQKYIAALDPGRINPRFTIQYRPDNRQAIADSLPVSISDSASSDWGWNFTLTLQQLCARLLNPSLCT